MSDVNGTVEMAVGRSVGVLFQVSSGDWALGDLLCDTWIACDVMSCTASILNLTAISVDRSVFTRAKLY